MKYSIIIPAFNEVESIGECVRMTRKAMPKAEIVVVDDCSTDGTSKAVGKLKGVKIVSYKPNRGKGFALRKGFEKAGGEIIITNDADCAVLPEELPKFARAVSVKKGVVVIGTRYNKAREAGALSELHVFGGMAFAFLFSLLSGERVSDVLCGTKAFRKVDLEKMDLEEDSWPDIEFVFQASKLGLKFKKIPVSYKRRAGGKAKMKTFQHGLFFLHSTFKEWLR